MATVILTLQLPRGSRGIPVATTANYTILRLFKRAVLEEWDAKVRTAEDEVESLLARLELERLTRALDALIPDVDNRGGVEQ